jgi:predicted MPP superfamily phosphohydrolase
MTEWLDDLRMRLELSRGSATLLLAIAEQDAVLDETRRLLVELLRGTSLAVADLGAGSLDAGPRRWAELTKGHVADVYVLGAAPPTPLSLGAMVRLYNAERELLRQLAGPMVLVVSRATEDAIRRHSPDFFTWVARNYELPSTNELAALAKQLGAAPATVEPPVPVEEPIRFLHISDVHLRPQRVKQYDQDRVLRGLVDFLAGDRGSFPLDLIFVTGDLAHAGKAEEYALVVDLLKRLMEVTGVPAKHVFVVPGNHDVDRDVGRWLLRTLGKDEEAIDFFEDEKSRALHLKKIEAYAESMRALLGQGRPLGLAVGEEAVEIVEVRGVRLAVASFNSAWFAQGEDDHGKLWLGESNVDRAGQRVADEEAAFAVALLHHPFDELHQIERDNVERYFERSFDVVIRGHLHKDKTRAIATQRGGFVEVAGPAAYQGSQWPNGCFLGEIRAKARTVRLRPYAYASGADGWVLDTKVFPDDEKDGYCHAFTVPEKRRFKSVMTKQLETAVEGAVRAAAPAEQRQMAVMLGVVADAQTALSDTVQRTAKAARSYAADPTLLERVLPDEHIGLQFGSTISSILRKSNGGARISRNDPKFLEKALMHVARAFHQLNYRSVLRRSMRESASVWAIHVALQAVLEPSMGGVEALLPGGSRPDLMLGMLDEPSEQLAVIEVMRLQGPGERMKKTERGLARLDSYLTASGAAHGALILLDALATAETEPQLEHATTPEGRDVLLLRL